LAHFIAVCVRGAPNRAPPGAAKKRQTCQRRAVTGAHSQRPSCPRPVSVCIQVSVGLGPAGFAEVLLRPRVRRWDQVPGRARSPACMCAPCMYVCALCSFAPLCAGGGALSHSPEPVAHASHRARAACLEALPLLRLCLVLNACKLGALVFKQAKV